MARATSSERLIHQTLKPVLLRDNPDIHLVKAGALLSREVAEVIAAVKGLPTHHVIEFHFSRVGFFGNLDRLMAELDDVSEFVHLETAGRSYILRIRHR